MKRQATAIPGYYTIQQAAAVIGRSTGRVTAYCRDGLLPAKNIGNGWLIPVEAARRFTPPLRGNPTFRKGR